MRQPYSNCKFSTGFVEGDLVDDLYFKIEKKGKVATQMIMRPDEMAAIAWVASGVLWAYEIDRVEIKHNEPRRTLNKTYSRFTRTTNSPTGMETAPFPSRISRNPSGLPMICHPSWFMPKSKNLFKN